MLITQDIGNYCEAYSFCSRRGVLLRRSEVTISILWHAIVVGLPVLDHAHLLQLLKRHWALGIWDQIDFAQSYFAVQTRKAECQPTHEASFASALASFVGSRFTPRTCGRTGLRPCCR